MGDMATTTIQPIPHYGAKVRGDWPWKSDLQHAELKVANLGLSESPVGALLTGSKSRLTAP
jgi:hypothetical protein